VKASLYCSFTGKERALCTHSAGS